MSTYLDEKMRVNGFTPNSPHFMTVRRCARKLDSIMRISRTRQLFVLSSVHRDFSRS